MIIRKLDFLKPTHDLPMFNFDVYNNKAVYDYLHNERLITIWKIKTLKKGGESID